LLSLFEFLLAAACQSYATLKFLQGLFQWQVAFFEFCDQFFQFFQGCFEIETLIGGFFCSYSHSPVFIKERGLFAVAIGCELHSTGSG